MRKKGNAPPHKKKKKEAVVTRKLFTEVLNEAASDEDDLPNTDNGSTNTTVDEELTLQASHLYPIILKEMFIILVILVWRDAHKSGNYFSSSRTHFRYKPFYFNSGNRKH